MRFFTTFVAPTLASAILLWVCLARCSKPRSIRCVPWSTSFIRARRHDGELPLERLDGGRCDLVRRSISARRVVAAARHKSTGRRRAARALAAYCWYKKPTVSRAAYPPTPSQITSSSRRRRFTFLCTPLLLCVMGSSPPHTASALAHLCVCVVGLLAHPHS